MKCRLMGHKWGVWRVVEHYWDSSWGDKVPASVLVRRCERCGAAKVKSVYGAWIKEQS